MIMKYKLLNLLIFFSTATMAQIKQPVTWSYVAKKTSEKDAVVFLKAIIENGWHIYSAYQAEDGPVKASFKFLPSKAYSLIGNLTEPNPVKKYESSFEMNIFCREDTVIFKQKIKLNKLDVLVKEC